MTDKMSQQQQQVEKEEMNDSIETWKNKFQELQATLAKKEERLNWALEKAILADGIQAQTLAEMSSTGDALKKSKLKRAALTEAIQGLDEESQQRELQEKEEHMKNMLVEEHKKRQEERQKKFEEDLQTKENMMRQEFLRREEEILKQIQEEEEKYQLNILEKEEHMKQQLRIGEERYAKLLAELRQPLESSAQQWALKMKDLEDKWRESNRQREEEEEKQNEEIRRLSEQLSHLQVRHFNLRSFLRRFQMTLNQM